MQNLIPFKGKNYSGFTEINLLQKQGNVYVMDNHLAALWCWLQEMDLSQKYNVLHIDKHYDTRRGRLEEWLEELPGYLEKLSIESYLALRFNDGENVNGSPMFTWDNYLPIFHSRYQANINQYHFFTHRQGDLMTEMKPFVEEYPVECLPDVGWLVFEENPGYKWIVNIDLDYFFRDVEHEEMYVRFISLKAIEIFFNTLKKINPKKIAVITFALSPECCGGWDNALEVMHLASDVLELGFDVKKMF